MQGAIVKALENRFKERRRKKKPRKVKPESAEIAAPPTRKLKVFELPPVPEGEDQTSFERHCRVLKAEFGKPNPNVKTVQHLMTITFPMRRRDILSEGHTFDPLKKYPFLQQPSYVSMLIYVVSTHYFCFLLYRFWMNFNTLLVLKTVWRQQGRVRRNMFPKSLSRRGWKGVLESYKQFLYIWMMKMVSEEHASSL